MDPKRRSRRRLRNEFIKSGAILLLAFVLLITAVVAWFGDEETAFIEPFKIKIDSGNDNIELGNTVVTETEVVLPCATILGDAEISVNDFSKALKVIPLEVESRVSNDVSISIDTAPGLHYYIDPDYVEGTDSAFSYADVIYDNFVSIKNNSETVKIYDKDAVLSYDKEKDYVSTKEVYRHMVVVVFWADYDYEMKTGDNKEEYIGLKVGDIIDKYHTIDFTAMMSFKVVSSNGE